MRAPEYWSPFDNCQLIQRDPQKETLAPGRDVVKQEVAFLINS
jgi:hypothetical protein